MKLLLAEDERSLARAIAHILEKNCCSTDTVFDGETALKYLENAEYDGVILDIMMPKLDGISVLRTMRSRGNRTPVLLLTAKAEIDDKVLGLDSGANDYLTKPFDTRELLARIRAMTRSGKSADSCLTLGNITLNRANYELSSPYGSYHLANKVFQMMELLLANPNQLISPDRFLEKIWGYDSDTEINVVWVYISYLRKKLTALKATVSIRAVRNAGYLLEENS